VIRHQPDREGLLIEQPGGHSGNPAEDIGGTEERASPKVLKNRNKRNERSRDASWFTDYPPKFAKTSRLRGRDKGGGAAYVAENTRHSTLPGGI